MLRIRRITSADAAAISALAAADPDFEMSPRTSFFPTEYLERWFTDPGDDVLYCAEADGTIVGFVLCQTIRGSWAIWHNVYVSSQHRRSGIGQALFNATMVDLHKMGIGHSVAFVRNPSSLPFYRANGASVGHSFSYVEWFAEAR